MVAQKFVAQKIAAAASHYCSGAALAAIPIFKESKLLYVDWGAVSSKIPAYGYDKFFTTIFNGSQPGVFAANVAVTKLGKKKLAMVDDRTPANGEFAVAFQKRAKELGAEVVLADHVTQGEKDFNAFVTRLKGTGAEVVYVSLYYPEAGLLTRQIRDQKVDVTIIAIDTCLDPQYVRIAGAAAEGVYGVSQPLANELPAAKEFVEAYKKGFDKEPGYIAPYAYDAMNVIARAYTAVGKVDSEAAAKWLKSLKKEMSSRASPDRSTGTGRYPSRVFLQPVPGEGGGNSSFSRPSAAGDVGTPHLPARGGRPGQLAGESPESVETPGLTHRCR